MFLWKETMRYPIYQVMMVSLWIVVTVFLPKTAHANVLITEVMYDMPGTDTGHEWIEVCNTGDADVVLVDWRLFEADTNHKIISTTSSENGLLGGRTCAIVADKAETFLADNAGYIGRVFDSTFSLSGTGETLVLRDVDLIDKDSTTYTVSSGGAGDGNTLSRTASGSWIATAPNPGVWQTDSLPEPIISDEQSDSGTPSTESSSTTRSESSAWKPVPVAYVYAGADRIVLAGAKNLFEGQAANSAKKSVTSAEYVWNFGDGTVVSGQNVYHTYTYPGTYLVHLSANADGGHAQDECKVTVRSPDIIVSDVGIGIVNPYIEIENRSSETVDMSFWYLRARGKTFQIPEYTRLAGKTKVRFLTSVTGLYLSIPEEAELLYPSSILFGTYHLPTTEKTSPEIASSTPSIIEHISASVSRAIGMTAPVASRPTTSIPVSQGTSTLSPQKAMSSEEMVSTIDTSEGDDAVSNTLNADEGKLPIPSVHSAVAASAVATGSVDRSLWFLALGGVIVFGIAGVVIVGGGNRKDEISGRENKEGKESDEYEILEDI